MEIFTCDECNGWGFVLDDHGERVNCERHDCVKGVVVIHDKETIEKFDKAFPSARGGEK